MILNSRYLRAWSLFFSLGVGFPNWVFAQMPNAQQKPLQAAVAMPDKHSAMVAKNILQRGGNAVDAAVAAGFVLAVTYPEAGNLGGGGFMTLFMPNLNNQSTNLVSRKARESLYFLDYREKAPLAASKEMYLDKNNNVIPYRSLVGYKASGVPGTVMGLWQAHQRFGSLPWQELLAPAIQYAEQGFNVSPQLQNRSKWYQGWVAQKSSVELNFDTYFSDLTEGKLFVQPELAATLKRLAKEGANDFYQGVTADLLVKQMNTPSNPDDRGLITKEDLSQYQAKWRTPVIGNWKNRQVVSAPPPSSGGIAILQLLKMKELLDEPYRQSLLRAKKLGISEMSAKTHFFAELEKRVYADRAYFLGDSDFVNVPQNELISESYLKQRASAVQFEKISVSEQIKPGTIESPETTHFSILDAQGNAVSNTYTLNMPFGNGVVIEGAGFLMNNEMDDFSTKPGVANIFGVVGGKANEIAPEKRMLSSMSPTLVLKDGEIEMVVGTPGGSTIITSVFQTIVNVVEEGMTPQQSVDAVRVHHQLLPKDVVAYNPELPDTVKLELESMGYKLKKNNYMGDVQLIYQNDTGLAAASDVRGEGVSLVFTVNP